MVSEFYSGPIPHPTILKGMDEAVPGAAREIVDMAQGNSGTGTTWSLPQPTFLIWEWRVGFLPSLPAWVDQLRWA